MKNSYVTEKQVLGVFRAIRRILIHATCKTGMERIGHTCVTNAFGICDEFVQIIHMCEKYELWILRFNRALKINTYSLKWLKYKHAAKKTKKKTKKKNNNTTIEILQNSPKS